MRGGKFAHKLLEFKVLENPPLDFEVQLDQLEKRLREIISMARNGQWDEIAAVSAELSSLIQSVSLIDPLQLHADLSQDQKAKRQQILSLLESAMKRCFERQQQIAPLLEALANPRRSSIKE